MKRYEIIEIDGLYCVFRGERFGSRIIAAFGTLAEAKRYMVECTGKEE